FRFRNYGQRADLETSTTLRHVAFERSAANKYIDIHRYTFTLESEAESDGSPRSGADRNPALRRIHLCCRAPVRTDSDRVESISRRCRFWCWISGDTHEAVFSFPAGRTHRVTPEEGDLFARDHSPPWVDADRRLRRSCGGPPGQDLRRCYPARGGAFRGCASGRGKTSQP